MARGQSASDSFTQVVYASVTESAANTLTFQKLETGYGTLDRKAWRIEKIEYYPDYACIAEQTALNDIVQIALTRSNLISTIDLSSAAVVDSLELRINVQGAAGLNDIFLPLCRDFTMLSGGGLIVLPNPLYLAIKCTNHVTAAQAKMRLHFTSMDLADNQWVELVESTRLLT